MQDRPNAPAILDGDRHYSDWTSADAWWLIGLPIGIAIALFLTYTISPTFYRDHILGEPWGLAEMSHFLLPLAAFFVCLSLLGRPSVRAWPALFGALVLFAVASVFIAGEEVSWGQWFFNWGTPEFWSDLNRQNETNLHNTSNLFNQIPQTLLEIAIVVGGLILPLVPAARRLLTAPILRFLTPSNALVTVSLLAVAFKILDNLQKKRVIDQILQRPSEALEIFFYLFILYYMILLRRRITLLDRAS